MAFNLRFYLLRLRHASLAELFGRMWQGVVLFYLRLIIKLEGNLLKKHAIGNEQIDRLLLPELIPDNNDGDMDRLDPWSLNPIDAQTDIRLRWEPARLQLAVSFFAWSCYSPKCLERPPNAQAARALIVSWIEANPFPRGEHYLSSMECALRASGHLDAFEIKEIGRGHRR